MDGPRSCVCGAAQEQADEVSAAATPTLSNTDLRWSWTVCREMCSASEIPVVETPLSTQASHFLLAGAEVMGGQRHSHEGM